MPHLEDKPHTSHREYTGVNSGLGPAKLKSGPVVTGEHATVYGDRHSMVSGTDPIYSEKPMTETAIKPKVTTPSIILDDLIGTDTDYFSRNPDHLEVTTSNVFGEDDDGYGIDEDLVSPVEGDEQKSRVKLRFTQDGLKVQDSVYVVGSFDHWRRKVMLEPDYDKDGKLYFKTVLTLPAGVYKVKFLVNGYVKLSTPGLATATEKSGNLVNWFEVTEQDSTVGEIEAGEIERLKIYSNFRKSTPSILQDPSQQSLKSPEYSRSTTPAPIDLHQTRENNMNILKKCPKIFETPSSPDEVLPSMDEEFIHKHAIPELPVYLNNNYLNKHFTTHHTPTGDTAHLAKTNLMQGLNSHIIPHVNLNHLLTSNIKNDVLGVACTTRYSGKFVTQIMYSPASDELE
ncbi:SNF1 protein kinase subunit beta-2 [Cyberlindnera fabianii]|uniref:SNF1 protein kinase subunit beta-2 n=1 Tax=Cyberlindnera fabianii TaxID=36022 RepID=A0A1V2L4D0_CYBFA|nr:SNF1 protein kinase subunit beta-2 [Cyberlindnera fabianii]